MRSLLYPAEINTVKEELVTWTNTCVYYNYPIVYYIQRLLHPDFIVIFYLGPVLEFDK